MNRCQPRLFACCLALFVGIVACSACSTAVAQTPTTPPTPKPAAKIAAAVPGTASNAAPTAGSSTASNRAPVAAQGVGTFLWPGGWMITAYGCFRTGTRLFCDFDTINQNNLQANNSIWGAINLVDDGGKITQRHNSFFVGNDGSQFTTAYISMQPVRFIIEYDDVDQRYTSVSLVLGGNRIQGVPIVLIDPSQPAGTIPARAFPSAPSTSTPFTGTPSTGTAPQTATPAASGTVDKATNTVNNVNTQKKKASDFWKSLQSTVQSH
jgi:hypothetical protein